MIDLKNRQHQRYLNFTCVFLNTITAGSVFTFPLFSPIFAATLHLSIFQTQILVSSAILGQYLSAVVAGYVCDVYSTGLCSLAASGLYALGYGLLGWRYLVSVEMEKEGIAVLSGSKQWLFLSFYYFIVGCGVSGSYFAAIISSTKSLPAKYSGLAIGIPLSIFGLSPLFLSFLASAFTSPNADGIKDVNPGQYLFFLAIFLAVVNAFSSIGLKVIPWEDEDQVIKVIENQDVDTERTPLLTTSTPPATITTTTISSNSESIREFIARPSFWIFGAVLILAIGPCEMTMASLGSIVESLLGVHIAHNTSRESIALLLRQKHVRIISIANTASRLAIGALSDYLRVSRLLFILIACILLACSFTAFFMEQASGLWFLSITTGLSYGTIFTMAPSIVRTVYPVEDFGRNYGLLSWFSAIGALFFTPLFGILGDRAAERQNSPICYGRECYTTVFIVSAASCVLSVGLVGILWIKYWRGKV